MEMFDTIAAVATPVGVGGIAIIRISGGDAESAAGKIVFAKSGTPIAEWKTHTIHLAEIRRTEDGAPIDEALVTVMREPNSYTGETVVEINCHGGRLAAAVIMEELFRTGVRRAEAGEFTRRAFLNGKCDLVRAEAVLDLIEASSEKGLENAAGALSGRLSERINEIRGRVLSLAAQLAAETDFPEEIDEMPQSELDLRIRSISEDIDEMLRGFDKGRIMRDGIRTVIAGRPNVGKSSLLNALARCERAIVTDIPGTTRDMVEEYIRINGIALRLIDTAGIRESDNAVEKIGIERAKECIKDADLCLLVLDSSEEIDEADLEIRRCAEGKSIIVILNKTDKKSRFDAECCAERLKVSRENIVLTATPEGERAEGIDALETRISELFMSGGISKDEVFISNERQKNALLAAQRLIGGMLDGIAAGMPNDLLCADLEETAAALGELTGATVREEIIDEVFASFCVGK